MFYLGHSTLYLATGSSAIPNGGRKEMLCGKRWSSRGLLLRKLKLTSLVWAKSVLIFVPLSPADLPLCISTKSNFDFHLGVSMHWSSFLWSVNQRAVKSSFFESSVESFFKDGTQILSSNTVFYFSNNFLQTKIKVKSMFSSLSHSFPFVSNLVSEKSNWD